MTPSNTREQTLIGKRQYSRLPERAMKHGSRFCPRLLQKLIVRGRIHEHADATHALGCCPRSRSGQPAAVPPRSVTKSRRLRFEPVVPDPGLTAVPVWASSTTQPRVAGYRGSDLVP